MQLDYGRPSPAWSSGLSVFGHIRTEGVAVTERVPALLPNLHVTLRGRATYRFADGRSRVAPPVAVIGATMSAFSMELSADYEVVCIGFLPSSWAASVGVPADRLADDVTDAADIWPAGAVASLWHAVAEAPGLDARRSLIEAFLQDRTGAVRVDDAGRGAAVQRWLERPGPPQLDGLADGLDLSWRQVERLTRTLFGASPKTLAMKYRALRTAGALAVRGEAALAPAMEGYADQSHMIRDFRRFVGWTPRRFLLDRHALASATMQGRWDAGVRTPLALLS
jgi:AraC-like DNA-binding protein